MGFIIEKTKHQEAYRCENRHFIPKYRQYGSFPVMDSRMFHGCCPECGEIEISKATGIWEREYQITGFLFKKKKLVKEKFIESIFSYHNRKLIEGLKKEKEKRIMGLNVSFKFFVCQSVRTIFESQGIVQTLAYERGGNKYWVKFSDNKLDAWFLEDELISIDNSSFGFKK